MATERPTQDIRVRKIDPALWVALKVEAARRSVSLQTLLNVVVREWLEAQSALQGQREGE